MARHEHDREDLLAEATALVERVELRIDSEGTTLVVGFRRDGAASFFLGADPVYQFNANRQLRRAFVEDRLYKAVRGRVVELTRDRTAGSTVLWRRELDNVEQREFLGQAAARLDSLRNALLPHQVAIVDQVPAEADVYGRVRDWLAALTLPLSVAASPRASG